ncbi:TonB-linked outer membrane protein, SusC/RagA family [Parapedobacter composti]|uniref:TonB-linked outer membrane protein, SusC/RagA family n=1 Tax=Parapedobacter composti TaxID=623281 RepID=A0A1I1L6L8_9SPHI|nr:SusC/RagA family TonB-linked outer membrane protein [Parapedobacter composti]SFC68717.1 TonB-linked outer membrane protein, SusC/RagA family [Parapedobacter composti]
MKLRIIIDSCLIYVLLATVEPMFATASVNPMTSEIQQQRITGKVTNSQGQPLQGVSITVKGTGVSVPTGADGSFSIAASTDAVLEVRLMGYISREVPVAGQAMLSITLEDDVQMLEDVVVTGYQTVSKRRFTGASATLKAEDVKRDGVTDVSRMLEGQVAGVSVQNVSGTFGAAPKIRIRGASSINGDNKPLWVVDGIILEDVVNVSNEQLSTGDPSTLIGSSVAGLNPDDIESFEILKDAAATSLYGARAMNGVIVITTKKGRVGAPVVSYMGNFSTYLKPSYSQFNIMNSYDQVSLYAEMERKGWLNYGETARAANGGIYTKMAELINQYDATNGQFGLRNDAESRRAFLERYAYANTDWFDILFNNSFMQEHALSVSSGTEKSQLYVSTSYLNDNGWSKGDAVERFTGNMRATFTPNSRLSYGIITQGSIRNQRAPGTLGRVSNAVSGELSRDFDINPYSYALNTSRALTAFDETGEREYFRRNFAPFNILHELENNTIDLSFMDLKVQGELRYSIMNNLKFAFEGAYRYAKTNQEHSVHENSNMPEAYRADGDATIRAANKFLYRDPDNPEAEPFSVLPYGGFYLINDTYLISYNLRNSLDYSRQFGANHHIRGYGFMELRYADRQFKEFNGYGYQFDKGGTPYVDPNFLKMVIEANQDYYSMTRRFDRFLAYGLNAGYSYRDKYNMAGTVRYDGSNLMGRTRTARWLPTWNLSGSWNVDGEDFFARQRVLSRATVRASYGLTASSGPATNSSVVLRNASANRPYLTERESVIYLANLENSELTWEKMYKLNIGADVGFLNNRLSLTVDYYNHQSYDLIGLVRTGGIGGEAVKVANYADMRANGVEATLNGTVLERSNWKWTSQLNFGYNRSEITNLKNEPNIWSLVNPDGGAKEGYAQRGLFSLDYHGLDSERGIPRFINEKGEISGAVFLQDRNTNYLIYEGSIDPLLTGGFFNGISYGNFRLTALVTFSTGNVVRLRPAFSSSYSELDATPEEFLNRWLLYGEQAEPSILDRREVVDLVGSYPYNNYNYSTARVAKGDFVRLKQVMFSYNLPTKYLGQLGVNNLSVSLVANNLWLIYADRALNGQDPEFFGSGGVAMPLPRQFTLSLKVGI